jgi:hypothetical protein
VGTKRKGFLIRDERDVGLLAQTTTQVEGGLQTPEPAPDDNNMGNACILVIHLLHFA